MNLTRFLCHVIALSDQKQFSDQYINQIKKVCKPLSVVRLDIKSILKVSNCWTTKKFLTHFINVSKYFVIDLTLRKNIKSLTFDSLKLCNHKSFGCFINAFVLTIYIQWYFISFVSFIFWIMVLYDKSFSSELWFIWSKRKKMWEKKKINPYWLL